MPSTESASAGRTETGAALSVRALSFEYPPAGRDRGRKALPRRALRDVSFEVPEGDFHCVLGPNGSGKSTLFRILSTAALPPPGRVTVFGSDPGSAGSGGLRAVRSRIGVVFQHPALDKRLTVRENLFCHGRLYGMAREAIDRRSTALLERFSLSERSAEPVGTLSGGLQRRVELVKALLHSPRLLLMDEPTTGLDPAARMEFLSLLRDFRRDAGATILYTTHILDEAEECDGLLILDEGSVVASGEPARLKAEAGRDTILLKSRNPEALLQSLSGTYARSVVGDDRLIRLECDDAPALLPELLRAYGESVDMVRLSRPTIEDVFFRKTGHRFRSTAEGAE